MKQKEEIISNTLKSLFSKMNNDYSTIIATNSTETRYFSQVEEIVKNEILEAYEKIDKKYLIRIERNNGSTKAKFELNFIFNINGEEFDVYLDIKSLNETKGKSTPFMGTINKYIKRIKEGNFLDVILTVNYVAEKNEPLSWTDTDWYFIKDVHNLYLYSNWQLMVTIGEEEIIENTSNNEYINNMIRYLKKFVDETIVKIENKARKSIEDLEKMLENEEGDK